MATYKDIQRATGLSLATISKYYNGGAVRPKNREAIEAAAAKLGFQINDVARSLRRGRSRTVGVLLPALDNAFHLAIIAGVERALQARGVSVIVCSSHPDDRTPGTAVDALRSKMVDGIIAVPSAHDVEALARAKASGLPVVTIDRTFPGLATDHVQLDNEAAGAMAAHHLADHRHTHIGMIGGDDTVPSLGERAAGFTKVLAARNIPVRPEWFPKNELTVEAGRRAVHALLSRGDRPSAIFTANYELTVGALIGLNESGLRIPTDISVVGFDVPEIAQVTSPRLTTVVQPMSTIAALGAERMLERMSGGVITAWNSTDVPAELLVGGSVAPPVNT
jgi:DNA-binding LacI/PurR family transcriptional regulator